MARKKQDRVELIATNRTQGAALGAVVRPLAADVGKWQALGWVRMGGKSAGKSAETLNDE